MVTIERPVDDKVENEIGKYEERFAELKNEISELRKKGINMEMADLLMYDFAPWVKMAKVTYDRADILKIKQIIKDIEAEVQEAKDGRPFAHILQLIKECYNDIRDGDYDIATDKYNTAIAMYKDLPKELKRTLYSACLDIKAKIDQSDYGKQRT